LASRLQEHLRRQLLDFKDASSDSAAGVTTGTVTTGTGTDGGSPPPTLISFTPLPTYTLGRRQKAPLASNEVNRMQAPLHMLSNPPQSVDTDPSVALPVSVFNSPRGGLTTYHGPGQVVLWPILDLRSQHHRHFTVKCYSRLLEHTTIATLKSLFKLEGFTTEDQGVWVRSRGGKSGGAREGEEAKIAALGVHLRRHVTSLGTAINVDMPGPEQTSEKLNPWARIVACGLEGKSVTSVAGEISRPIGGDPGLAEQAVADVWAGELAERLGLKGVETVAMAETLDILQQVIDSNETVVGDDHASTGVVESTILQEKQYVDEARQQLSQLQRDNFSPDYYREKYC